MAKKRSQPGAPPSPTTLFQPLNKRRHPRLFLPKYLEEEAERLMVGPAELERTSAVLKEWADRAKDGHLNLKETSLDAEFLQRIFGEALNYKSVTESPHDFHREKNPTVAGAGIADGALGLFISGKGIPPSVIIELKGANTDLDHDKFAGRTPVQQCWDYLNQLPDTPWGIVSNYVTIRLYHKASPARAYEEFTVNDFYDPSRVKQFYYLFEKTGLVGSKLEKPRAFKLLHRTQTQQREVGDKLYNYYALQRERLIGELMDDKQMSQDDAIHVAQRLLDRIIFMAFCEDRGLLPEKLIEDTWSLVPPLTPLKNPRWKNFRETFDALDVGHRNLDPKTGFNGGLFKHDPLVDDLDLPDRWTDVFKNIADFDFSEDGEISIGVLDNFFERSVADLEKLRAAGCLGRHASQVIAEMSKSDKPRLFGTRLTSQSIVPVVRKMLEKMIAERLERATGLRHRVEELRRLKIIDPACGCGACLAAAYDFLEECFQEIACQMRVAGHLEEADNVIDDYPDYILAQSLHGIAASPETVDATRLALWIRTARKGKRLADLSNNICYDNDWGDGNRMRSDASNWRDVFPLVYATGAFDIVIGTHASPVSAAPD